MAAVSTVSPDALVRLHGIAKRWDATAALAPVSLTVAPGELVVVRGRSGTGKTTLLAILAGWCDADGGEIQWHPELVPAGLDRPWSATAIVPQVLGVDADRSVAENVELVLRAAGARPDVAHARAHSMLARVDLLEEQDRWPRETSFGQQQRLAVARAMVARPRLVLADEPTSHQDAGHAALVIEVLQDQLASGGGALVASHEPLVVAAADRVIELGE